MVKKDSVDSCKVCNMDFTKDKTFYVASGMCKKCYDSLRYTKNFRVRVPDTGFCKRCNVAWGSLNSKGKEVKRASNNLCRNCYHRVYKQTDKLCVKCNELILNKTAKDICSRCFVPVAQKRAKNPKDRLAQMIKNNGYQPSKDDYERLRKLLNRFKFGVNTSVDAFITTDFFISLITGEGGLSRYEGMEVDAQIIYMLKDLKEVYELYKKELTMNDSSKKVSYSSKR